MHGNPLAAAGAIFGTLRVLAIRGTEGSALRVAVVTAKALKFITVTSSILAIIGLPVTMAVKQSDVITSSARLIMT
jgi:hypothetical protein